ncbi:MAG: integrase core domain-containing protein [Bosea sp. (in: a-proteobacteria)]|nr:integrase core domain-containing protein [Bosea sp. (in: a-proteobacteria)]
MTRPPAPHPTALGNGCIVSLNARLRNEILDSEIFHTLTEAKISIESRRRPFDTIRSHGELGHRLQKSQDEIPTALIADISHPGRTCAVIQVSQSSSGMGRPSRRDETRPVLRWHHPIG